MHSSVLTGYYLLIRLLSQLCTGWSLDIRDNDRDAHGPDESDHIPRQFKYAAQSQHLPGAFEKASPQGDRSTSALLE